MALGRRPSTPDPERVAIDALGFIAADPERLDRFLALTGLVPETIRASVRDPAFLTAVLGHVMSDERLLLAFSDENRLRPEALAQAQRALAGANGELA